MQEHDCLRVQEDGINFVMSTGGLLAGSSHLKGPQKAGDQELQLLHILLLCLHHAKYQAVPFPHVFRVRGVDVLGDDLLPPAAAQPSAEEGLNLLDLPDLVRLIVHTLGQAFLGSQAPSLLQGTQLQSMMSRESE